MDSGLCNVIYLDRSATKSGLLRRDDVGLQDGQNETRDGQDISGRNIRAVLTAFSEVTVCTDGSSCLKKISQVDDIMNPVPTIVLIDIPSHEDPLREARTPSPTVSRRSLAVEKNEPFDIYGTALLSHLTSSIHQRVLSRLIVPVAMLSPQDAEQSLGQEDFTAQTSMRCLVSSDSTRMVRYLDAGAADVLTSPLLPERVQGLPVHAYRVFREVTREDAGSVLTKRNRKLSWIGIEEERPFAYLREAMVSGLMEGICNPESVGDAHGSSDLTIDPARKSFVAAAVGQWSFSAHDFTSDELVYAALMILEHALQTDELARWRMSTEDLTIFLLACRRAYNDFVLYHNFRHVIDVLQAIFYFLLRIGLLPPYQAQAGTTLHPNNAVAAVLKPFDALTLLVAAIGHDVGHPGVNNAFLVALNAPLAQLYNDRSVLEAFHCAAYSQILRRYWPAAFSDMNMRKLMITSILATDMGLHFKYIMDMGNLQEKLAASQATASGWSSKAGDENRDLVCGLLIKCADISNVARKYAVAAQWARILTDEFSNQGAMEKELNLPTCLFGGPPDPSDAIKMAESQIGFMNIFARPLFEGVSDILPNMHFTLDELATNKAIWQEKIEAEQSRQRSLRHGSQSNVPATSLVPKNVATISDSDSHSRVESTPSNPSEKDSLFTSRNSQGPTDQGKVNNASTLPSPSDAALSVPAEDSGRPLSMRTEADKPTRVVNVLDSRPPISSSYSLAPSPSRRSSKDIALDSVDQLWFAQRNSCSRPENQNVSTEAHGSADGALTTTHVRSQKPTNDAPSSSQQSSPVKSTRSITPMNNAAGPEYFVPSPRSHATSNTTTNATFPISPLGNPSLVEDSDPGPTDQQTPIPSTENPFLHPNKIPDSDPRQHSASAPDVLVAADGTSPEKTSIMSQITSGGGDDRSLQEEKRDIRQSRSHSRLRGLKFWRKRWKSSELDVDPSP